jgi:hypothetical protein
MRQQLFHNLGQLATDRWARRGIRTLLRAAWLGVSIWCVGLGGHLLWGWPLRTNILGALALAVLGLAIALLLRPRLRPKDAARRLDRRFHLDEQLATAVEVAATNPPPGSVAARLVAESSHTAELLRRRIAQRQRPPWNDLLTLAMLGLVAAGLTIIAGIGAPNLAAGALPIPPLAAPQDPIDQLPREAQPQQPGQSGAPGDAASGSQPGAADPQIVQALADALRDQGVTRPAASALDRGDLAGAARELRALADQASQIPPETQRDLADRLRQAADQIGQRNQSLTDQLNRSADQLEQGGPAAAQALEDMARAIEQLPTTPAGQQGQQGQQGQGDQPQAGEQPGQDGQNGQGGQSGDQQQPNDQSNGQGQGQGDQGNGQGQGNSSGAGNGPGGDQRQANTADRLGVEGQPVPLDSSGAGDLPAQPSGPLQGSSGQTKPGFAQGDSSSGQRVDVGDDPLRVPIDERDVVQEYFQP